MSTFDDDIEFDFFDEPETAEATQRRRLPSLAGGRSGGGAPRPPMRGPTGLVPLARLVGLIAIAITVVVALVFWVGACQGASKHSEYTSYMDKVRAIAQDSHQVGVEFANRLVAPGLKIADLETSLEQWAQQEQQAYEQAQQIRPPGPLRQIHQRVLDTLELRAKGLAGLANALSQTGSVKDAATAANTLSAEAQLLTASDIVWTQLYKQPAIDELKAEGVTGVVAPSSQFISNSDLVSARSFTLILDRLQGASTGGTPSGLHGDGLISVRAVPQGVTLSSSSPTTVKVSADLAFQATVEDSGDFQEVNVPVTLKIDTGSGKPITRRKSITVIQPAQQQTVTIGNLDLPPSALGNKVTITVNVGAVAGEKNTSNNHASYPVFFTLS